MDSAKRFAVPLGIAAAVLLLLLVNPWVEVSDDYRPWISYLFWIIAIALLVVLYMVARSDPDSGNGRGRGPGVRAVPVQQLTRGPVLAADPALPRLLVARGGLAQAHR